MSERPSLIRSQNRRSQQAGSQAGRRAYSSVPAPVLYSRGKDLTILFPPAPYASLLSSLFRMNLASFSPLSTLRVFICIRLHTCRFARRCPHLALYSLYFRRHNFTYFLPNLIRVTFSSIYIQVLYTKNSLAELNNALKSKSFFFNFDLFPIVLN